MYNKLMAKKTLKYYFKSTLFVVGTTIISVFPFASFLNSITNISNLENIVQNSSVNQNTHAKTTDISTNLSSKSLGFSVPSSDFPNPEWKESDELPSEFVRAVHGYQYSNSLTHNESFNFSEPIDLSYCLTPQNKIQNIVDYDPNSLMMLIAQHFENHPETSPYLNVNNLTSSLENLKKNMLLSFVDADINSGVLTVKVHWKGAQISFDSGAYNDYGESIGPWIRDSNTWDTSNKAKTFDGSKPLWLVKDATFKITGFPVASIDALKIHVDTQYDVSDKVDYKNLLPTEFMSNLTLKSKLEDEIIANNVKINNDIKFIYQGFNPVGNDDVKIDNPIHFNKSTDIANAKPTLVSKNWRYTSTNNDPYNVSGSLFFDIKYKNFYNENGEWIGEEGKLFTITVTGFKAQSATTVESIVTLPSEYSNIFVQFPFDNPQYNSKLLQYLKFNNSPAGDDYNNFFIKEDQITWTSDQASRGEFVTHIGAKKWYNNNGVLVTDNPNDFVVTFKGFRKVSGQTIIDVDENNTIVTTNNSQLNVNDVSITDLKNIIFDHVLNKPDGFNVNNIIISDTSISRDSERGEIRVTPSLSLFYDDTLYLRNSQDTFTKKEIIIKGFKKVVVRQTTLPNSELNVKDVGTIAPYEAINSESSKEKMKIEIMLNSKNLPPNFSTKNIFFTNLENVDLDGKVLVSGYINYFYDENLNLTKPSDNKRLEFSNLNLLGFKKISPTVINNLITIPNGIVNNISPENVDDAFILNLIRENLNLFIRNIPNGFDVNQNILDLTINHKDPLKGKVFIEYKINKFFEISEGTIQYVDGTKKISSGLVEINNFKVIKRTSLNSPFQIPEHLRTIIPSTLTDDLVKELIIYPYYKDIFSSLPDDFNISNILDVELVDTNNAKGSIKVNLKINKYYSNNGTLVNKNIYFRDLVINGFNPIPNTEAITDVTLTSEIYSQILPQHIDSNDLLSIINNNKDFFYRSIPDNFEIISITINSFNNLNGSLKATIVFKNYYTGEDSHIDSSPFSYEVNVRGFMSINPTSIVKALDVSSNDIYSSQLVENVLSSDNSIKDFLLTYEDEIFQNLPYDFSYNNIKINEIVQNNLEGSAVLKLEINYYYKNNNNGQVIKTNFGSRDVLKSEIKVTGFKKSLPTKILDEFIIPNNLYDNLLPSEVTEEQLKNIIWVYRNSIIENLPYSFSSNDIYFDFSYVYANNLLGTISVNIELYKYYDNITGMLIEHDAGKINPLTKNVIIGGFKVIGGKTSIPSTIDANNLFPNNNIPKPSDLNINQIMQLLLTSNSIINIPKDFSIDNMRINQSSMIIDNINGVLSFIVEINNFYDKNGVWNNNPDLWLEFPVTINNLSIQPPTKILNIIELPEFKNVKASDLSDTQLLDILRKNSYNLIKNPSPTFKSENIKSFKITSIPNNKLGQISGTITLDNFYNKNGFLNKAGEILSQDVILIGFETIGRTYANDVITFEGFENRLPSNVSSQEIVDRIYANKELIYSNLPNGVVNNDLIISIDKKSNQEGTVTVSIKLLKYFNSEGTLITTQNKDHALDSTITIKGFKKVTPTSIIDSFNVLSFHNTLPSDVDSNVLFDYIWNNRQLFIDSIPDIFDQQNMQISLGKHDNKNGTLFVNISLSSYYDKNSQLVVDSPKLLSNEVLLSGFKKIQSTNVVSSVFLPNYSNVSLTTINNKMLKDIIYLNKDLIFFNLVNDKLALEDFDVNIKEKYNKTGIIIAEIILYKYYDKDGDIPSSSVPFRKSIEISGFKQISPSLVQSIISIKDNDNPGILKKPYDYISSPESEKLLRELITILEDQIFINMPEDFSLEKNLLEVYAPNTENARANAKGELIVYLTFNNYYDGSADLQNSVVTKSITITGFDKIAPTSVNELIFVDDESLIQKLPQFVTEEELREFLISKINANNVFFNIPESFNQDSISPVKIISFDNKKGSIEAMVSIKNYYDNNGILENNKIHNTKVVFNGFIKSSPTMINNNIISSDTNIIIPIGDQNIEPNYFENMSTEQLNYQLKKLTDSANNLLSNSIVLPDNKTTRIEIKNYVAQSYNNQNGTILVTGNIYDYIDENGIFVKENKVVFEITGFKIKNSFNFTSDKKEFKYALYAILAVVGVAAISAFAFFVVRYKRIRGLKD